DEQDAADIALGLEVGTGLPPPVACRACRDRVAAVRDQAQQREKQAEKSDLHGDVTAAHLHELRQEGEEENRRLRVEKIDDEAIPEQAAIATAFKCCRNPWIFAPSENLLEAEPDQVGGAGIFDDVEGK